MKRVVIYILFIVAILSCINPRYNISKDGFSSNRELWGLSISKLSVDSINQEGFPSKYEVVKKINAGQKGDHEFDDPVKDCGYNWKPQKYIPFKKVSKYYSWWDHSTFEEFDVLPITFQNDSWYLLTQWRPASAGGGRYNLFVFVNENGEFEKHFDIQTGPW